MPTPRREGDLPVCAGLLLYATPATMFQLWRSLGGTATSISSEQLRQALPGALAKQQPDCPMHCLMQFEEENWMTVLGYWRPRPALCHPHFNRVRSIVYRPGCNSLAVLRLANNTQQPFSVPRPAPGAAAAGVLRPRGGAVGAAGRAGGLGRPGRRPAGGRRLLRPAVPRRLD